MEDGDHFIMIVNPHEESDPDESAAEDDVIDELLYLVDKKILSNIKSEQMLFDIEVLCSRIAQIKMVLEYHTSNQELDTMFVFPKDDKIQIADIHVAISKLSAPNKVISELHPSFFKEVACKQNLANSDIMKSIGRKL